jgi:hypothetical protein
MRSLTTKEFCARPDLLLAEGDLVLTADGAAIALVIGLHDQEDAAELVRLIRRARAEAALQRIRERARAEGLDSLTMDEIDAEIATARAERKT